LVPGTIPPTRPTGIPERIFIFGWRRISDNFAHLLPHTTIAV
jgi:exonuclease V gamma subunit